jgi:hypothetical protein
MSDRLAECLRGLGLTLLGGTMDFTEKLQNASKATEGHDESMDPSRREAILRIGRFAAYTAPGLLVMLTGTAYAQADSIIRLPPG